MVTVDPTTGEAADERERPLTRPSCRPRSIPAPERVCRVPTSGREPVPRAPVSSHTGRTKVGGLHNFYRNTTGEGP